MDPPSPPVFSSSSRVSWNQVHWTSWSWSGPPGPGLPLRSELVAQDKVSDESQRQEENGEDEEVQVEFGVQHVQLLQDGVRLLEVTGVVLIAVQVGPVQTVDGQDDALEAVPETQQQVQRCVKQGALLRTPLNLTRTGTSEAGAAGESRCSETSRTSLGRWRTAPEQELDLLMLEDPSVSTCVFCGTAPPPDIGDVGNPLQVPGDGVEADEEPGEQQNRDGGDRTHERGHLQEQTHLSRSESQQENGGWGEQTCREVEAAPISRPRLCATRDVRTPRDRKRKKRAASGG